MSIEVRRFHRADREQLAALVNAHVGAVVPGMSVSVNAVLSQLEREPGEFIVDPWVSERVTLVAEQRGRVVAAAHLLRYGAEEYVGASYRDSGEVHWFLFWPEAPYWPDSAEAGEALLGACVAQLDRWGVGRQYADGSLPAPGVYGVPEQWPHVRAAYEHAGFVHEGRTEVVYVAAVDDLPTAAETQLDEVVLRRSVGINGTRLTAVVRDEAAGFIEVETLEDAHRLARHGGWADVGNLRANDPQLARWLVAQAADWLRLARVERLLDYTEPGEEERAAFLASVGFRELTRTARGWVRYPAGTL